MVHRAVGQSDSTSQGRLFAYCSDNPVSTDTEIAGQYENKLLIKLIQ